MMSGSGIVLGTAFFLLVGVTIGIVCFTVCKLIDNTQWMRRHKAPKWVKEAWKESSDSKWSKIRRVGEE